MALQTSKSPALRTRPALFTLLFCLSWPLHALAVQPPLDVIPQPGAAAAFPFMPIPGENALTDLSSWLEKPAGKNGFVIVRDGHFYTEDGKRIKFFDTNLTHGACFPSKPDAEKLAATLARYGINLVRMHHMDAREAPEGIWRPFWRPRQLDPEQLDRLDYLIAQLKKHGIYTNLNLHVSRRFSEMEGYPAGPRLDKGVTLFVPGMVEAQKEYARELLTHFNPYTGTRYVDEPAIAMVEITNENAIFHIFGNGDLDKLGAEYSAILDQKWHDWLTQKYGNDDQLRTAWGSQKLTPSGAVIVDGPMDASVWTLENGSDGKGTLDLVHDEGIAAIRLSVQKLSYKGYQPQAYILGLKLQPERSYRIEARIRADRARELTLNILNSQPPYNTITKHLVKANRDWQEVVLDFKVPAGANVNNVRFGITRLAQGGSYWITDLKIRELTVDGGQSGGIGLPDNESLANRTVKRPQYAELGTRSAAVQRDYIDFLWSLEQSYFDEMRTYIKQTLGARAPLTGTQVPWSPAPVQATMDYIDAHAYWQHQVFPVTAWDGHNWYTYNIPMAGDASGGTLPGLSHTRLDGKPFVVSEYNHPAPNTYNAEAMLLAAAYGALQDWDAIVSFCWSSNSVYWPNRITSYFELKSHPAQLATLPAAAAIFLRGDVQAAKELYTATFNKDQAVNQIIAGGPRTLRSRELGLPAELALRSKVAMAYDPNLSGSAPVTTPAPVMAGGTAIVSDTRQLRWDWAAGSVTIRTANTQGFIGRIGGEKVDLGSVQIKVKPEQHKWASLVFTALDGADQPEQKRILVTAAGYAVNAQMGWRVLNAQESIVTLTGWGAGPAQIEGITADIFIPAAADKVRAYALDAQGYRREAVAVESMGGESVLKIGPGYKTVWYEIVID